MIKEIMGLTALTTTNPSGLIDQDGLLPSLSDIDKGIKDTLDN